MNVIEFGNRNCKRTLDYLDSYISDELPAEAGDEVSKHLENCAACSRELDARLRAKDRLQGAVRRVTVPAGLEGRIRNELRKGASPAWRYWLAAAAMVTLVAGGLGAARLWRSPETLSQPSRAGAHILQVGLDNHVHCAIESRFAERRFSAEEMATRLGAEYSGLVPLVEQAAPGEYDIAVGHRCRAKGRQYVHLILKSDRASLSLVITRKNGESFERSEVPAVLSASGVQLYGSHLEGYEVAGLETGEFLAFLVSDLAAGDNLQVASAVAAGVRDFPARLEA